ncbi:Cation efflux protein [Trema orientale]|uniref:Cation efflux protein n=1 Tax=Trema orientale TaxID=63057 RepID=A0A2P5FLX7_TREOI|nr:Cation efflux protein [Trema orientale]
MRGSGGLRTDSLDYRTELLSPEATAENVRVPSEPLWWFSMEEFKLPESHTYSQFGLGYLLRTAPPEYLAKLTYLIWNHHEEVKHIETVRAYKFGSNYFVEIHIVLPGEMSLGEAHTIRETLQEKIEKLPEVERAFVHVDFDITHKPEHKPKVP